MIMKNEKWKIGYKILAVQNKNLVSYSTQKKDGGIRYYINKVNMPKKDCGPLAVFKTLKNAMDALYKPDGYCIYQCEYVVSKTKYFYSKAYKSFKISRSSIFYQEGTEFVDKIILIKRIGGY